MISIALTKIDRRVTLRWLVGTAVSGIVYQTVSRAERRLDSTSGKSTTELGYGTDPDLLNPIVPWDRTMTTQQLRMVAALADLILSPTSDAPVPSALGIHDFVDEWVSAPYPEQQGDRAVIFDGLAWLEAQSELEWHRGFLDIGDSHRGELLRSIIPQSHADTTVQNKFFRRFRYVVVGAYYTTAEGAKELGYIGNIPLASYPPVSEKERAILDAELRRLRVRVT